MTYVKTPQFHDLSQNAKKSGPNRCSLLPLFGWHYKKEKKRKEREMICLQQFYNIFITNLKWQVVASCYCWVKKVILVAHF